MIIEEKNTMRELFSKVLKEYIDAKSESSKGHDLAYHLRSQSKHSIETAASIDNLQGYYERRELV